MALGENIKKYRKEKGLTQKAIAKKINKSCSTFQKYELNLTQPPVEVIMKIANILEVSMMDLLYDPNHDTNEDFFNAIEKESEADIIMLKNEIINAYNRLNELGRCKVSDYILDLSDLERYTTSDQNDKDEE